MTPNELQHLLTFTESFDLPESKRIEIVKTVYGLMESFVDEAWGVHPVQLSCEQLAPDHLQSHNPDSNLNSASLTNSFDLSREFVNHETGNTTH